MGKSNLMVWMLKTTTAAGLLIALSACSYDYLQNTDKVSLSAGDAVKGNLESQTIDPSNDHQYDVDRLGKDGQVVGPGLDPAPTP